MTRDPGGDGAAIHVDVPVDDRAVADEDMVGADVTGDRRRGRDLDQLRGHRGSGDAATDVNTATANLSVDLGVLSDHHNPVADLNVAADDACDRQVFIAPDVADDVYGCWNGDHAVNAVKEYSAARARCVRRTCRGLAL